MALRKIDLKDAWCVWHNGSHAFVWRLLEMNRPQVGVLMALPKEDRDQILENAMQSALAKGFQNVVGEQLSPVILLPLSQMSPAIGALPSHSVISLTRQWTASDAPQLDPETAVLVQAANALEDVWAEQFTNPNEEES